MKIRHSARAPLFCWIAGLLPISASHAGVLYSFQIIDGEPNPGQNGGEVTYVQSISDDRIVVGYAMPDSPCSYSFILDGNTFERVDLTPGSPGFGGCIRAHGVNNRGQVVGSYGDHVETRGFRLDIGTGEISQIVVPNTPSEIFLPPYTVPQGISNSGFISGYVSNAGMTKAFLFMGGKFGFFDIDESPQTYGNGVNDFGQIAGSYVDTDGRNRGFTNTWGFVVRLDYPGAFDTVANGINDRNIVVGTYRDSAFVKHGFIYEGGQFTPFDFPVSQYTEVAGINNRGQIVGSYSCDVGGSCAPNKPGRGFVATPTSITQVARQAVAYTIRKTSQAVTVVIPSTRKFDAVAQIDQAALRFGRTGSETSFLSCKAAARILRDGLPNDLVCSFSTAISALQCGDSDAFLTGKLLDRTPIRGSDRIEVGPCR